MRFKRSYYFRFEDISKSVLGILISLGTIPILRGHVHLLPSLVQRDVHLVERTTRVTFLVWTNHSWLACGLCKI